MPKTQDQKLKFLLQCGVSSKIVKIITVKQPILKNFLFYLASGSGLCIVKENKRKKEKI
jgi:hypothetical protein